MSRPDSRWIEFVELGRSISGRTRRFEVRPRASDSDERGLGMVTWYGAWRRYAFHPEALTVFESQCLRDIAAFCDWLMAERKAGRR